MQFYSWQKFTPVGPPMVEPKWIQWDPDVTATALAYTDSLVVCRARPTFKAIASLSIQVCSELHYYSQMSRLPLHVMLYTALACQCQLLPDSCPGESGPSYTWPAFRKTTASGAIC